MTAIVSGGGYAPPNIGQLFSKLDTNQDGSVDKSEFVAGANGSQESSSSSTVADQLFSLFDSDQDGKLTKGELQTGFQKLGDGLKSLLISQQETPGSSSSGGPGGPGGAGPKADQLFASLDSDQSGSVDEAEFLKGPADAPAGSGPSDAEKKQLFTQFDTNQDGSLSKSELETGFQSLAQNGPHAGHGSQDGPPPSGGSGGPGGVSQSGGSQSDNSLSELIKLLESTSSTSSSSDSTSSTSAAASGTQAASIASLLQTLLQHQLTTTSTATQVTA